MMASNAARPNDPYKPPTDIMIVTTPFISSYHFTRLIGATFGLIVRSRGFHQALQRLAERAKSLGANAVVSLGFTAVVVEPDGSPAQPVALHQAKFGA